MFVYAILSASLLCSCVLSGQCTCVSVAFWFHRLLVQQPFGETAMASWSSVGPAPVSAPAPGNNKDFTVATMNVGAKDPESFVKK